MAAKQTRKRTSRRSRKSGVASRRRHGKLALDDVVARFAGCGRCSFFLAGYRVQHEPAHFEEMVEQAEDGWLTLPWSDELRRLVLKSYGTRVDISLDYLESCCPECWRTFTCTPAEQEDQPAAFRIMM